ncbi:MAG: hypothetical protein HWE16_12615 [Gammaproteobacteria bacterium]|nr:hypothetical protein [Gammaproteobacteria bacterium]
MKKVIGILIAGFAIFIVTFLLLNKSVMDSQLPEQSAQIEPLKAKNKEKTQEAEIIETQSEADAENVDKNDTSSKEEVIKDSCNDFRNKHPQQEAAFNAIMAEIFMSDEDASDTSVFTNMDWVSLNALANGGDKDALFFLGDGMAVKAIYGKDFYGPKEVRNSPSSEEIKNHKVQQEELTKGFDLLFKAGVRGKLGAFLSLQMNSDLVTRQLIRTEPSSESEIKHSMANLIAYNRLLSFIHTKDEPFRLMFAKDAKDYYSESIEKHYGNWKPELSSEQKAIELKDLHKLADQKYQSLEQKWIQQREFYGFETHPKLLDPKLEAYLMQVSELCWS